ncbi:MAG: protein kinase domain-containing protein [Flammeovirgaceae bacterium]
MMKGFEVIVKMGYIHRDIKPANIFKSGKNWKIGDFGFAINS